MRLSRLLKSQANGTTGPPSVNEDGSRFQGKQAHFYISIAQWSVEEDNTIIRKLAKDKGKTHDKDGKTGKCTKKQDDELINSFQNYDSRRLLMFLYQGWYLHKDKETSFLTSCMAHFGLTVTSLVKSRHQREALLVQVIFIKEFFL